MALHNRSVAKTDALLAEHGSDGTFVRSETIAEFLDALEKPRRVLIMVKAGDPTDAVINELAEAMEDGDIIIDGGNALYTDTIRRAISRQNGNIGPFVVVPSARGTRRRRKVRQAKGDGSCRRRGGGQLSEAADRRTAAVWALS